MSDGLTPELVEIDAEIARINSEIDALYWTYTRTKRGKPPVMLRPDLYQRRAELNARRRELLADLRAREFAR